MSRPRPASISVPGRGRSNSYEYQSLTPRTPHSRSGRAEEGGIRPTVGEDGFHDIELEQISEEEDHSTADSSYIGDDALWPREQAEPLLAADLGYRRTGDDDPIDPSRVKFAKWDGLELGTVLSRIPVVIGSIIFITLAMVYLISLTDRSTSQTNQQHHHYHHHHHNSTTNGTSSFISYEQYTSFPLQPHQYRAECIALTNGFMRHAGYWNKNGSMHGSLDVQHDDDDTAVCASTITYQLDPSVGLMADLALLAQAAALAREQNRTFFVDDTFWNRGKWIDHFEDVRMTQPGMEPNCRAPPPNELVACPRFARHWVINAQTAKFHFGHGFDDQYENAYAHALARAKPIFQHAADSLATTITPNGQNRELIHLARGALVRILFSPGPDGKGVPGLPLNYSYLAVHLRRGDRLAESWPWHKGWVPLDEYVNGIQDTWKRVYTLTTKAKPPSDSTMTVEAASLPPAVVYLASDSPVASSKLISQLPATTWVFTLATSNEPALVELASPKEYIQGEWNLASGFDTSGGFRGRKKVVGNVKAGLGMSEAERIRATRGMIVDFAMLSGAWLKGDIEIRPVATVCTISSNICKLAAVGLGWDCAFGGVDEMGLTNDASKAWVEIDTKGSVRPVWRPFELFN